VPDTNALIELVKIEAVKDPQPEIHIRGDVESRYEDVGRVMYAIQRGGVVKVGFITEPDRGIRGVR
jgi:biopolymer transport protein ExbD